MRKWTHTGCALLFAGAMCLSLFTPVYAANATPEKNQISYVRPDNDVSELIMGNAITEGFASLDDSNWYKVRVTKSGFVTIYFAPEQQMDTDIEFAEPFGYDITVFDHSMKVVGTFTNIMEQGTLPMLPLGSDVYFINVTLHKTDEDVSSTDATEDTLPMVPESLTTGPSEDADEEDALAMITSYTMTVFENETDAWEVEGNDALVNSSLLHTRKEEHGTLSTMADVDWYRFSIPAKGEVLISFTSDGDKVDIGEGFMLTLYSSSGGSIIDRTELVKNEGSLSASLPAGTYYVKVMAQNTEDESHMPIHVPYTVYVDYAASPGTSTITMTKTNADSITLHWTKARFANGYYIFRSSEKNSEYRYVATVDAENVYSYTDTHLLGRHTYYYKVIPFHNTDTLKLKGSISAHKTARTK